MGRAILAVVVGYVAMAAFVFLAFTLAYLALGADVAFQEGTYDVSLLWYVVSFVLSFVAAVVGGLSAAAVAARGSRAPEALAVLVLVLGLATAVWTAVFEQAEPGPRTGEVGNMEAMTRAQQPLWVVLVTPFVGVAGVLLGARMRRGAAGPGARAVG